MADRILLIGMMGAGKTTVGRLVAERLGWRYVDSDEQVVAATGKSVREIFESEGEAAYRAEEARALAAALIEDGPPSVISVAGGAVLDPNSRARIAEAGTVVWLDAPVDVLVERATRGTHRPLLDGDALETMTRLRQERVDLYASLADAVVDVAALTPEEAAEQIIETFR